MCSVSLFFFFSVILFLFYVRFMNVSKKKNVNMLQEKKENEIKAKFTHACIPDYRFIIGTLEHYRPLIFCTLFFAYKKEKGDLTNETFH